MLVGVSAVERNEAKCPLTAHCTDWSSVELIGPSSQPTHSDSRSSCELVTTPWLL